MEGIDFLKDSTVFYVQRRGKRGGAKRGRRVWNENISIFFMEYRIVVKWRKMGIVQDFIPPLELEITGFEVFFLKN